MLKKTWSDVVFQAEENGTGGCKLVSSSTMGDQTWGFLE